MVLYKYHGLKQSLGLPLIKRDYKLTAKVGKEYMRIKITGFANFKTPKKDDPSIIYSGVYLYGVTPVDPQYGQGLKTATLTVWQDQLPTVLPDGPESTLDKKYDVYFKKNSDKIDLFQEVKA